jgi:hypothetical protein
MDIIDKIFNKFQKEKAPFTLRDQVLRIADKPASAFAGATSGAAGRRHIATWLKFAVPALVLLLIAGSFFYFQYYKVPLAHASFELTAEQSGPAGVEPGSGFILKSSAKLSVYQVIVTKNPRD